MVAMPENRKRLTEVMATGAIQMGSLTGEMLADLEDTSNNLIGLVGGETMPPQTSTRRTRCYNEADFPMRSALEDFIEGPFFKALLSVFIILSLVLLVTETDMRSEQRSAFFEQNGNTSGFHFKISPEFDYLTLAVSGFFVLDLCLRLYVYRKNYFKIRSNMFDFGVVASDVFVLASTPIQDLTEDMPSISVLRVLRMFRVIRFLRNFLIFRELYLMMQGLATALRSIVFATFLIAIVLMLWSILAVEFVHIPNLSLHTGEDPFYEACPTWRCEDAFATVWFASLTFLKTIVAGDGWGQLAYPLITRRPTTAFVLLGSLCMVQLGLLNLIVAVIVDRARCARESDQALVSTEKKQQLAFSYKKLHGLFCMMDEDGSGALQLDELTGSYFKYPEFREVLDALDVKQTDLDLIFDIIDHDRDGNATYEEFVQTLHEMKEINTSTMLVCIRHVVQKIAKSTSCTQQRLGTCETGLRGLHRYMSALNEKIAILTGISAELKEALVNGKPGIGAEAAPDLQAHVDELSCQAMGCQVPPPSQAPPQAPPPAPTEAPPSREAPRGSHDGRRSVRSAPQGPRASVQVGIEAQAVQEAFVEALDKRIEALKPRWATSLSAAARTLAESVVQASVAAVDESLQYVLHDVDVVPMPDALGLRLSLPSEEPAKWNFDDEILYDEDTSSTKASSNRHAFERLGHLQLPRQPTIEATAAMGHPLWEQWETDTDVSTI